jgi:hypothetical protein
MAEINLLDNTARVADRVDEFYRRLSDRMKLGKQNLLRHLLRLGVKDRLRLQQEISLRTSLKEYVRRSNGEVVSVGYSFELHGIYLARGVGKGRPKGSSAANKAAKDWLTPELDLLLDEIADLIADGYADIVVAELRINVPGFFTKTIPSK